MAILNFPTSPSLNDTYSFNGKTWVWNGQGWQLQNQGAINSIVIGNSAPAAGTFTTLSATGNTISGNITTAGLVSAIGNITGGNLSGTSIAGTLTTAAQTNITSVGTLSSLAVTANVTGGNILTGGQVSATGNISGTYFIGNGSQLSGIVAGIKWTTVANTAPSSPNAGDFWYNSYTSVKYQYTNDGTSSIWVDQSSPTSFNSLTTVTLSASGNITGNYIIGNGSQLTGLPASYGNANVAANLAAFGSNPISTTGNITSGNLSVGTGTVTIGNIVNSNANGVGNIGSSTAYFNTAFVKATSAQYADLAEYYKSDADYLPGTVVVFGGQEEITISNESHDTRVAGVISTAPAYIMNSSCPGLPVALTGRVPCQVQGPVSKGDVLVTSAVPGVAQRIGMNYKPGCVLGKSLEEIADDSVSIIEVVVGRF